MAISQKCYLLKQAGMFIPKTRCQSTCHWWRRKRPFEYSCGSSQCWYSDLVSVFFFLLDYFPYNVLLVQGFNIEFPVWVWTFNLAGCLPFLLCTSLSSLNVLSTLHIWTYLVFLLLASFYKEATDNLKNE